MLNDPAHFSLDPRDRRLDEPHLAPLMSLIERWRGNGHEIPNPDPCDGGVNAKALFLLESPGPKAVGSFYISQENKDPSAANMGNALNGAGFSRDQVLLWNVVPYCVSSRSQNRNASPRQIRDAAPYTQAFIDQLKALRAVVFCGRRAQLGARYVRLPGGVEKFETFHPGAMAYNRPRLRAHLHETFAKARAPFD